jgi:hypothetical protein
LEQRSSSSSNDERRCVPYRTVLSIAYLIVKRTHSSARHEGRTDSAGQAGALRTCRDGGGEHYLLALAAALREHGVMPGRVWAEIARLSGAGLFGTWTRTR